MELGRHILVDEIAGRGPSAEAGKGTVPITMKPRFVVVVNQSGDISRRTA
jgi:hypothetical protein